MKKILLFLIVIFLFLNLLADQRDSALYVVNKKTNEEFALNNNKNYVFVLKDGRKIEGKYTIIDKNTIELKNQQTVYLTDIEKITNDYGQLSKSAFLASGDFFLLSAAIVGIVLFIRHLVIQAQNQGAPPNSGEWGLPFFMIFLITIISSIGIFFAGIVLAILGKKYSSEKYNLKIK